MFRNKQQTYNVDSRDAVRRYVLGMNYWEQFTNAIKNLLSLACVANHWRASVIQPFTVHSRLYGLPGLLLDDYMNSSDTARGLDLILDPASMESVLRERGLRSMSLLEDMLRYGDRKLVFLHFVSVKPAREYRIQSQETNSFLTKYFQKSSIVDCTDQPELIGLARLVASNLNSLLVNLTQYTPSDLFHLHKYLCVNMSRGSMLDELESSMGIGPSANASIVVINWRGLSNGSVVHSSSKGPHASNRFVVLGDECVKMKHPKPLHFEFSETVLSATETFMQEVGVVNKPFMVVHFRSEKMVIRQSRFPRLLPNCFNEALQARDELLDQEGATDMKVLYFADVGPFGSETCKKCKANTIMGRLVEKYNVEISQFSPAHYDLPLDRGFVAAVEMSLMSHASHMILVGGGSFQTQLKMKFEQRQLATHYKARPHAIVMCSTDQQAREVTQRFSPPAS